MRAVRGGYVAVMDVPARGGDAPKRPPHGLNANLGTTHAMLSRGPVLQGTYLKPSSQKVASLTGARDRPGPPLAIKTRSYPESPSTSGPGPRPCARIVKDDAMAPATSFMPSRDAVTI